MTTAVDTSVLTAVAKGEAGARAWTDDLVPDFLIGAHAQRQADRVAAVDRGYLRRYFPRLRILKPA
jgi:predicted nucleic acid-binding protein